MQRSRVSLFAFVLVATICVFSEWASGQRKSSLAIKNVSLFDSLSGRMLKNRTILISGDRVRQVGTREKPVSIPDGTPVIDGKGKYVIPGLIDAHVHLVHLSHFMHVTGDEFLPMFLAAGVTTVRSTGDPIVAQAGVANYARARPNLCPRVFLASPLIDRYPPIHRDVGYSLTDPAKVPAFVADMARWNVVTLKIYAGLPPAVAKRVIEVGHKHGMKITAHLGAYTAQAAAADGIDCFEHIESVFNFCFPPGVRGTMTNRANLDLRNPKCQALIKLLAKNKVAIDPTMVVFRNMLYLNDQKEYYDHPDVALCPERMRKWWTQFGTSRRQSPKSLDVRRRMIGKYQQLTGMLHKAGVPILVGTDAPEPFVPPGFSLHQEMEMLVGSGLTPAEVLQAATMNNARILNQEKNLGSVTKGKLADLVILSADPTKNIKNTRKIVTIIRGGLRCNPKVVLSAVPRK